jgi:hypothetical protein
MSANNAPTAEQFAQLLAQVTAFQNELTTLRNQQDRPNAVIFAETPQMLEVENLINYGSKREAEIYRQGWVPLDDKSLTDGFNMMPEQTITFIEALQRRCTEMGWNSGTKNITSFQNKDNVTFNIIKSYGQINKATLQSACKRFCSAAGADSRTRARQNNTMKSVCLAKSLAADAQARLLTYQNDYLIEGIECALLMYKVIMWLATIDSVATTQALCDNLHALGTFASTVSGDIDKINAEFDKNYSQLIARGATVDDPIGILFAAYQVVPCFNFKTYTNRMHEDYLEHLCIATMPLR